MRGLSVCFIYKGSQYIVWYCSGGIIYTEKKEIVFTLFTKSIYKAASDGTVSDAS